MPKSSVPDLGILPSKRYEPEIKPGDPVGNMLYVCDKPLGIEDGEVCIHKDDERFVAFKQAQPNYDNQELTLEEINRKLMVDFIKHCAGTDEIPDNPFKLINALVGKGVDVYMVKQDGKLVKGKVGPSRDKIETTSSSKEKKHRLFEMFDSPATTYQSVQEAYDTMWQDLERMIGTMHDIFTVAPIELISESEDRYLRLERFYTKKNAKTILSHHKIEPTPERVAAIEQFQADYKAMQKALCEAHVDQTQARKSAIVTDQFLKYRKKIHKGYKGKQENPMDANFAAIQETFSTHLAGVYGQKTQSIQTIQGKYQDGSDKVATVVKWQPGFNVFTDGLRGCKSEKRYYEGNYLVKLDAHEHPILIAEDGREYDTVSPNGDVQLGADGQPLYFSRDQEKQALSENERNQARMMADDNVHGLGEALLPTISLGDRDSLGSRGQNKGKVPMLDASGQPIKNDKGETQYEYYGIDFGKALSTSWRESMSTGLGAVKTRRNNFVDTLRDDFTFRNPPKFKGWVTRKNSSLCNVSMLSDNTLSEKMKGVYMRAALKGKLPIERIIEITKAYEAMGDHAFAEKFSSYANEADNYIRKNGMPEDEMMFVQAIRAQNKAIDEQQAIIEEAERQIKMKSGKEVEMFNLDSQNPMDNRTVDECKKAIKIAKKAIKYHKHYRYNLEQMEEMAQNTDKKLFKVFESRLALNPDVLNAVEHLEKATAKAIVTTSPNGQVLLNHIQVPHKKRVAWDARVEGDEIVFKIRNKSQRKKALKRLKEVDPNNVLMVDNKGNIRIPNQPKNAQALALSQIQTVLSEANIAQARQVPFLSNRQRMQAQALSQTEPTPGVSAEANKAQPSPISSPAIPDAPANTPPESRQTQRTRKRKRSTINIAQQHQRKRIRGTSKSTMEPHAQLEHDSLSLSDYHEYFKGLAKAQKIQSVEILPGAYLKEKANAVDVTLNNGHHALYRKSEGATSVAIKRGGDEDSREQAIAESIEMLVAQSKPTSKFSIKLSESHPDYQIVKDSFAKAIQAKYPDPENRPVIPGIDAPGSNLRTPPRAGGG